MLACHCYSPGPHDLSRFLCPVRLPCQILWPNVLFRSKWHHIFQEKSIGLLCPWFQTTKKNALLRHVSRLRLSQHPNFKRQPSLPFAYAAKAVTRFFFRAVLSGQLCLKVCQQCFPSPMPLADRAIDLTRTGVRAFLFTIECLKYLKVFSHLLRTHDLAITVNTAVGQTAHRNPQLNRTRFIRQS